jgi:hypothetical protein
MPDPDYPQAESDLHANLTANPPSGTGSYTQATSPQSQINMQASRDRTLAGKARAQKLRSISPGQVVAGKPSIKGRTNFSDEQGD